MEDRKMNKTLCASIVLILLHSYAIRGDAGFAGGTGEPNDPYQIATADDLMLLGESPEDYDKHFILTADIDLDPNLPDGRVFNRAVIAPNPNQVAPFTGSFDGNGHTIANLTIEGGAASFLGLFGKIGAGGWVHNLRIENASITGADSCRYLGALAGYIDEECSITNCSATGRVAAGANAGAIGGLAGFVWFGGRITQCFASCDVYGGDNSEDIGGMVGTNGGVITNCYASGSVSGGNGCNRLGGLVGVNKATIFKYSSMSSHGHIIHCYATGTVYSGDESGNLGGLVGERGESYISSSFWDIEASGMFESAGGTGLSTAEMQDANTFIAARWDLVGERINGTTDLWLIPQGGGYPVLAFFSDSYHRRSLDGTGSLDDPYRIATAEDLGAICHYNWSACYKLVADIDLSGIKWATAPIANFNGTLDGAGFVLSNLTVQGEGDLGLFCVLDTCAHVRNLGIEDANLPGGGCVGALVGLNYGHISDCFVGGNVYGDDCVGLLVGYNKECGTINNSRATGSVSPRDARYYAGGGLVGYNIGTITNSHAGVEVTGQITLGGLVGINSGNICGCYARGRVTGEDGLGGLAASNRGTISNSYATVDVYSMKFGLDVGGLVGGYNAGTVVNCYAAGSILNEAVEYSFQGGLIGRSQWTTDTVAVINCFWNTQTSGIYCSSGGIGLTTAQMMDPEVYSLNGWAGDPNWVLDPGNDYPRLAWEGKAGQIIPEPVIDWLDGSGTQEDPYIIATAEQLARVGTASILWDKVFVLASDLDITGIDLPRIGVCPGTDFTGTFDGDGHTISNFTYTSIATDHIGLFGYVNQGHIKELGLIDPNIDAGIGYYVGSLVGFLDSGTITNCYAEGGSVEGYRDVSGLGRAVGGLVGTNSGTITYSYSAVSVSGNEGVSGLVGGLVGGGYEWRVTASFWDIEISGQTTSAGGIGKTTAEMQTASTFLDAGWDFVDETENGTEDIWWILEGQDYPRLRRHLIEGDLRTFPESWLAGIDD